NNTPSSISDEGSCVGVTVSLRRFSDNSTALLFSVSGRPDNVLPSGLCLRSNRKQSETRLLAQSA
ncbi:MAG: hypothetical protein V4628_08875, partial [Pseudomonadota bacterium]